MEMLNGYTIEAVLCTYTWYMTVCIPFLYIDIGEKITEEYDTADDSVQRA